MVKRRWQLIAYMGVVILAIVLLSTVRQQGNRITKIEKNQTFLVQCDNGQSKACQEALTNLIHNATPSQLRLLTARLVGAATVHDGKAGANGKAGTNGKNGHNGTNGRSGKNGAPGARGATGSSGAQGLRGLQGPVGPSGPRGHIGPPGPIGPIGPVGPTGPPGANAQVNVDAIAAQVQARICARLVNVC